MTSLNSKLILVDEQDRWKGTIDKMTAHQKGLLHRAFSVFIINKEGEMLLQQRAAGKYHSPSLWTNACCSHPMAGEEVKDAAARRLQEELGFTCKLSPLYVFQYKAYVGDQLWEHEMDHVFYGHYEGVITPNKEEVQATRYVGLKDIAAELAAKPDHFTAWFRICFAEVAARLAVTEL